MRSDKLYLTDIIEATEAIAAFTLDLDELSLAQDVMRRSAVLHQLMVIGEAVSRLSDELKSEYPDVAWADIKGFRNILVHAYFSLDMSIVWIAVSEEVPLLEQQVRQILHNKYAD